MKIIFWALNDFIWNLRVTCLFFAFHRAMLDFFFFLWSTWFHVQLMGFGFENLMWFIHCCQEPPREIPPMTKVMRRGPGRQRQNRTRGTLWTCSSIDPETKTCLSTVYYIMPFTNSSDINRGLSPTTFLWKKST